MIQLDGLPEPSSVGAHFSYSKRVVVWSFAEPGVMFRNAYRQAWIEVTEQVPWKNEPLSCWAQRYMPGDSWVRNCFTDSGRKSVQAVVIPAVNKYGFGRLWTQLHSDNLDKVTEYRVKAETEVRWWKLRETVSEMYRDGLLQFRAVDTGVRQPASVRVVRTYLSDATWVTPSAEAWCDGEQVGWMTTGGEVIPLDHLIRDL